MEKINGYYFTVQEVSDILKVDTETVYRWIREEKIIAYKFGGTWRIPQSEIEKSKNV